MLIAYGLHSILTWHWDRIALGFNTWLNIRWTIIIPLNQVSNAMVPTNDHPLFDGTQTSLGPPMLDATYLGIALVWIAEYFCNTNQEGTITNLPRHNICINWNRLRILTKGIWISQELIFSFLNIWQIYDFQNLREILEGHRDFYGLERTMSHMIRQIINQG